MIENIKHYTADEEGRALIHPSGKVVYYCGEPEDSSFFRDHSYALDELDRLFNIVNKYGTHAFWCNSIPVYPLIVGADYTCNCGWVEVENKLLFKE